MSDIVVVAEVVVDKSSEFIFTTDSYSAVNTTKH